MRIHVNLPSAGTSSSPATHANAASTSTLQAAPAPLTALTPHGELLLIELQGSLEIEHQSPAGGQTLGTISFDPLRPDRPVLMISHHRLEGKFVNLVRPLAVLEKKVRAHSVLVEVGNEVGAVRRSKRPVESGETLPKRARDAVDFSSSPPSMTPVKARPLAKASGLTDIVENAAQQGSAKQGKEEEDDDDAEEPQTAVYYDVVSVIKRKILFSKRPEPIVRLDTSPTAVRTKP
ncbi:uncharacterized protein SRS1_13991 [Sporisorium reilianum f. sp. reilianum]|uniref:Chromosome transmission fidelity protein 8 n=1 Tax=Sporisorium reilianum f. sp. reilianum TaxID=72559 RepID=A0A2N8UDV8_9BASI|nr:uncharacterized protein SRS1_13991 [Sporisorium reilianum f. sp. reilianum]